MKFRCVVLGSGVVTIIRVENSTVADEAKRQIKKQLPSTINSVLGKGILSGEISDTSAAMLRDAMEDDEQLIPTGTVYSSAIGSIDIVVALPPPALLERICVCVGAAAYVAALGCLVAALAIVLPISCPADCKAGGLTLYARYTLIMAIGCGFVFVVGGKLPSSFRALHRVFPRRF